MVKTLKV